MVEFIYDPVNGVLSVYVNREFLADFRTSEVSTEWHPTWMPITHHPGFRSSRGMRVLKVWTNR